MDPERWYEMGKRLERPEKKLGYYQGGLKGERKFLPWAWQGIGDVLFETGKGKEADEAYEKARTTAKEVSTERIRSEQAEDRALLRADMARVKEAEERRRGAIQLYEMASYARHQAKKAATIWGCSVFLIMFLIVFLLMRTYPSAILVVMVSFWGLAFGGIIIIPILVRRYYRNKGYLL